jgi:hypothetical protein
MGRDFTDPNCPFYECPKKCECGKACEMMTTGEKGVC